MSALLLFLVRAYQRWISPLSGPKCRFYPSCSAYAAQALVTHGAVRGSALAVWRLMRCHPFTPGGYDPVPPPRGRSAGRAPRGDCSSAPPTDDPRLGARPGSRPA